MPPPTDHRLAPPDGLPRERNSDLEYLRSRVERLDRSIRRIGFAVHQVDREGLLVFTDGCIVLSAVKCIHRVPDKDLLRVTTRDGQELWFRALPDRA